MNMRVLVTGIIASVGLMTIGARANASCVDFPVGPCSFLLNPSVNPTPPPPTVHGASGTYRVTIASLGGSSYGITVVGLNTGNPPTGTIGTPNPGPQSTDAKAGIDLMTITAVDASSNTVFFTAPIGSSGSSTAHPAPPGSPPTNLGGHSNLPYGTTASVGGWGGSNTPTDSLVFNSPAPVSVAVAPRGGNQFTGTFTVSVFNPMTSTFVPSTLGLGSTFQLSAQDNGQQWSGKVVFGTPEPSALALVLPGLAPLGLALRRRRSTRS